MCCGEYNLIVCVDHIVNIPLKLKIMIGNFGNCAIVSAGGVIVGIGDCSCCVEHDDVV